MSDHIAIAKHDHPCDLCGGIIPKGSKCRIIHDDFMPKIVYFEHLRCPTAKAIHTDSPRPMKPIKHKTIPAFCCA